MKVLFIAPYIYDSSKKQFSKNKTGFGMILRDIISQISNIDNIYLITNVITKEEKIEKGIVLSHTLWDLFRNIKVNTFTLAFKSALSAGDGIKDQLRHAYETVNGAYIENNIKRLKPDIIHIHGAGHLTDICIDVCKELGQPCLVTLHGLLRYDSSATKEQKKREQNLILRAENEDIPIFVISSGIKKRVVDQYGVQKGNNIRIILNGTCISNSNDFKVNIRAEYNVPKDNKIILCIGSITERKNQLQIIKAFSKMKKEFQNKTSILFLGNDTMNAMNGSIQKSIKESGYERSLIYCGFIDKHNIPSYFAQANLNIVASLDEGFGLSMIEGFVYGVPTVTFSDLDAIEDLYHEKAMVLVHERSDEALAESIETALEIDWDKKWIQEYSKQFSLEQMAQSYHNHYENIIESWKCCD